MKKSEIMSLFSLTLMVIMIVAFYFTEPTMLIKNIFLSLITLVYITISFMAYEVLVGKVGDILKSNSIVVIYYAFIVVWIFFIIFFIKGYLNYYIFNILKNFVVIFDVGVILFFIFNWLKK